jgi:serine/threonine protein kinase
MRERERERERERQKERERVCVCERESECVCRHVSVFVHFTLIHTHLLFCSLCAPPMAVWGGGGGPGFARLNMCSLITMAVDVWSFGAMAIEMATAKRPYSEFNDELNALAILVNVSSDTFTCIEAEAIVY